MRELLAKARQLLRRGLAAIDGTVSRVAIQSQRLLIMPLLIAVALAATAWPLLHRDRLAQLAGNKLAKPERSEALLYLGVAAGGLLVLYGLAILVVRLWAHRWRTAAVVATLNRWLSFLLAAPFVVWMLTPKVETKSPRLTLIFALIAALACLPTFMAMVGSKGQEGPLSREDRWGRLREWLRGTGRYLAPLAVLALLVAYAYFFSKLAITNHHGLASRTTDLGYYDNIFYQSIHGRPLDCTFLKTGNHSSAHFDPILVVLSPLYLLYPRAEGILVLQSVWLAIGVLPAYLIGKHHLGSRTAGVILAAVYALYPALHGANMYEFHSLTLLVMPFMWAIYFIEVGHFKRYYLLLPILLLIREDVSLVMCFVGGYAILTRRPGRVRLGWITILVSLIYLVVVKTVFMTSPDILQAGKNSYSFAYYYRDLIPKGESIGGLLTSLFTNPTFLFDLVLREGKLTFAGKLLVPLLFLPLFAKRGRFILIYGAIFLLLATRKAVYEIHFQYTAVAFPAMIMLVPAALRRLRDGGGDRYFGLDTRRLSRALLGSVLVATALCSWKFGAIAKNASFRGGFQRVVRELNEEQAKRYAKISEMVARIEPGASVSTTNQVGPHVSNRKEVYFNRQRKRTHYVFVNEKEIKGKRRTHHQRRIARGELELLDSYKQFKLFRVHADKRNAPVPEGAVKPERTKKKRDKPRSKANRRKLGAAQGGAGQDGGAPQRPKLRGGKLGPKPDDVDIDRALRDELPR